MNATVKSLHVYPVKGLKGIDVSTAALLTQIEVVSAAIMVER